MQRDFRRRTKGKNILFTFEAKIHSQYRKICQCIVTYLLVLESIKILVTAVTVIILYSYYLTFI